MENNNDKVIDIGESQDQPDKSLQVRPENQNQNLPSFPTNSQIEEYKNFLANYDEFISSQLNDKVDYGVIPGVNKPSLLKPGAEKLEKLFFLTHEKKMVEKIIEPDFIKYTYKTTVFDKNGNIKATCEGTCNSKETKYRYITVFENQATEAQKKAGQRIEKKSKAGKPYFVIRVEKQDFYDVENTIMKMAQKRSYVGAILEATGSSGRFTQDVEDMDLSDSRETISDSYSSNNSQSNNNFNQNNSQQNNTPNKATAKQINYIKNLRDRKEVNRDEYVKKFGADLGKYTTKTASDAIAYLDSLPDKKSEEQVEKEIADNIDKMDW